MFLDTKTKTEGIWFETHIGIKTKKKRTKKSKNKMTQQNIAEQGMDGTMAMLERLRYHFTRYLLYSDFTSDVIDLRNDIARCLVCLSGLKSAKDEINDKKMNEKRTKFEELTKNPTCDKFIRGGAGEYFYYLPSKKKG